MNSATRPFSPFVIYMGGVLRPVKKWRTNVKTMLLLLAVNVGCSVHVVGLVQPDDGSVSLVELNGSWHRLALSGDNEMLRFLDGHLVSVEGSKHGRRVDVMDFTIEEGLHGMQVWVGHLESTGTGMGLLDKNSGAFYVVDKDSEPVFSGYEGSPVLIEGYVNGPNQIKVMFYRSLSEDGPQ
jgi:hypothetical protein